MAPVYRFTHVWQDAEFLPGDGSAGAEAVRRAVVRVWATALAAAREPGKAEHAA